MFRVFAKPIGLTELQNVVLSVDVAEVIVVMRVLGTQKGPCPFPDALSSRNDQSSSRQLSFRLDVIGITNKIQNCLTGGIE